MTNIVVLGAGRVGIAIAADLAARYKVLVCDFDKQALDKLEYYCKTNKLSLRTRQAELAENKILSESIDQADLVINALPGFLGFNTLKSVIENNKDIVDISFFPENSLTLDELAKTNNVTAVVDMGVAPGMSNLLLGYHDSSMRVDRFACYVGGLPKFPEPPFNYKAPFSPVDVIEEYIRPARFMVNGEIIHRPAMSDIETMEFQQAGKLQAFNTDGLRTLLFSMKHVPNMIEKTLRYPGHVQLMLSLKEMGFFDKTPINTGTAKPTVLDFTSDILKKHWQLENGEQEFTVMRVLIEGDESGNRVCHQYDLYDEFHETTQLTSMARTTGYACTAVANLLLTKRLNEKGIITPEKIGGQRQNFKYILDYLNQRNVIYRHSCTQT